jgi:hypothetical protein
MKSIWNSWLKQAVFLYSALYTFATISNSVLYLLNGYYEDPNGNWHELDRAIIVFIITLAYILVKTLKLRNYWLKALVVYVPTLLLVFVYIWVTGIREPLAANAYRDIFINYTIGYMAASVVGWFNTFIKRKNIENN